MVLVAAEHMKCQWLPCCKMQHEASHLTPLEQLPLDALEELMLLNISAPLWPTPEPLGQHVRVTSAIKKLVSVLQERTSSRCMSAVSSLCAAVLKKDGIFTFSVRIFFCTIDLFFARNGAEPVSISNKRTPRLHQSAALEWPEPEMISGAISMRDDATGAQSQRLLAFTSATRATHSR